MLPPVSAYSQAIARPSTAFTDKDLRKAHPKLNRFGLPIALAGGFAATYRLTTPNGDIAVRCFHRESPSLAERYQRITHALASSRSPFFLNVEYSPKGVCVGKEYYPIVRMDWAPGLILTSVIRENHRDKALLAALISQFGAMEQGLQNLGIAHGDLQPENLCWDGSSLRLLDYDGMYVPGMTEAAGAEAGHRHFQHPGRNGEHFGPTMDRFSLLVLTLSLRALWSHPGLYGKYAVTDENILFTCDDFKHPDCSPLFQELSSIAEFRGWAELFRKVCMGTPEAVPTLSEFRRGLAVTSTGCSLASVPSSGALVQPASVPIFSANDYLHAVSCISKTTAICLVGRLHSSRRGKSHTKLFFSDPANGGFTVTLRGSLSRVFKPTLVGKRVVVTGHVASVSRHRACRTTGSGVAIRVVVDDVVELRTVTEREAHSLLVGSAGTPRCIEDVAPQAAPRPPPDSDDDVILEESPATDQACLEPAPRDRLGFSTLLRTAVLLITAATIAFLATRSLLSTP
jgi:hypothetical protein